MKEKELLKEFEEECEEIGESFGTMCELALELTAYERQGFIDIDDFIKGKAKEAFYNLNEDEQMRIWNNYCRWEDYIYTDLKEMLEGMSPYVAIRCWHFSNASFNDNYYKLNGYGNIESAYCLYDFIEFEEIYNCLDINDFDIDWGVDISENETRKLLAKMALELVRQGY